MILIFNMMVFRFDFGGVEQKMERKKKEKLQKKLEKEKAEAEKAKSGADGKVYDTALEVAFGV